MTVLESIVEFVRHIFIPGKSNNQRPRILHPAGLSVLVAVFLLNYSLRTLVAYLPGFVLGFSSSVTVDEVVTRTNEERGRAGLPTLVQSALLTQAAYAKATDMMSADYWAHVSPTGTQPWSFIKNSGYTYRYAGENLARDFSDTPAMMSAWMSSASHRENILSNRYSEIGVAVLDGTLEGVETRLVVQMFAAPATVAVAQAPQSPSRPVGGTASQPGVPPSQPVPTSPTALEETAFALEERELIEPQPQFAGATAIRRASAPISESIMISPTEITQAFGLVLVSLILGTLVVDWVIAHRRRSVRLVGRNWAHITYLTIVVLMLLQYAQGRIL